MQPQTLNSTLPPTAHTLAAQPSHNPASFCEDSLWLVEDVTDSLSIPHTAAGQKLSSSQLQPLPHRDPTSLLQIDPNKVPLLSLLPDSLARQCRHIAPPQCDYSQLECVSSDARWQQRQRLCDVYSFTSVHRFQKVQPPAACHYWLAAISSLQI